MEQGTLLPTADCIICRRNFLLARCTYRAWGGRVWYIKYFDRFCRAGSGNVFQQREEDLKN